MSKKTIERGNLKGTYERNKRIGLLEVTHDANGTPLKYPCSKMSYEVTTVAYNGTYEVVMDLDEILSMAHRAAKNNNRKCKSGPVIVKVRTKETIESVKRDPVTEEKAELKEKT